MWLVAPNSKDCWDYVEYGDNAEQIYETITTGLNSSKIKFSNVILTSFNVEYSFYCSNVKNIFGCVGLRKKDYCIFNKQYSKEEYEKLVRKIKKHMDEMPFIDKKGKIYGYGEFFPPEISPYPYNQTSAQEFFPIGHKDAEKLGYKWENIADKNYIPTLLSENLPDSIEKVSESVLNEIIECDEWKKNESKIWNCTKAFRITENELVFYKKYNLPLPRKFPNCRHHFRTQGRNPPKLWHRQCMCDKENHNHKGKCIVEFETSYAPERPEIVYCEKCYQQEIY
jgi:hypothetical protein